MKSREEFMQHDLIFPQNAYTMHRRLERCMSKYEELAPCGRITGDFHFLLFPYLPFLVFFPLMNIYYLLNFSSFVFEKLLISLRLPKPRSPHWEIF